MSISLELSTIQYNSLQSAIINTQVDEYLRKGGVIQRLEIVRHAPAVFNSETIAPSAKLSKAVNIQKSAKAMEFERVIAEKLRAYVDLGIAAAAKDLGLGTQRINFIAANYGIQFSGCHGDAAKARNAQKRKELAPQVRQMAEQKMSQSSIADALGITRATVRRIAKEHNFIVRLHESGEDESKLVERILAIRDIGCTREQCMKQVGVSRNKILRLMEDYDFDYPVVKR